MEQLYLINPVTSERRSIPYDNRPPLGEDNNGNVIYPKTEIYY